MFRVALIVVAVLALVASASAKGWEFELRTGVTCHKVGTPLWVPGFPRVPVRHPILHKLCPRV